MNNTIINQLRSFLKNKDFLNFNILLEKSHKEGALNDEIFYNYKGNQFFLLDNIDEAITCFQKSIDVKPNFDSYLNLGTCFLKKKEFNKALDNLFKSLDKKKDHEDTYILIFKALLAQNKNEEAYNILFQGLKNTKDQNKINYQIGVGSLRTKDFYQGIVAFNKILKKNPKNHIILNFLGVCYEQVSAYDQAEKYFRSALELKPNFGDAMCNLANILRGRANFEEAKNLYRNAIELNFQKETVYRYLSTITKFTPDNCDLLNEMEKYTKSKEFEVSKKKHELYFALFKAYEDLKNYDKSKQLLIKSNDEVQKHIYYDHGLIKEQFGSLKNIFNKNFIQNNTKELIDGRKVIFIVGMPRSGTTLVEQIISSHSKVFSAGELFYFQKHLKEAFPSNQTLEFANDVKLNFNLKKNIIGKKYIEDLKTLSSSLIVTDKLPFNFIFIGFIKCIFKNIKIIHCKRDSLETCFSIYKNYFPYEDIKFAYSQNNLSKYYKAYEDLMNYWKSIFDNEIHTVYYDQLVNNQKKETEKLLDYCNLDWEDQCLEFYKNKSNVQTLSTGQVRQPIYQSSIKSWEKYKDVLQDLINGLN